jgi:hypothetical protein
MPDIDQAKSHMRTAVLVVHGIGSQRAQETVRGVIRGVWLDSDDPAVGDKRLWTHPEPNGADIDLAVMTTNAVPDSHDKRSVDFHELYWAHLMSETKAVAVLLWLFELGRKGPIMKLGMNGLWWAAAIFLCLLNLSIALVALQGVLSFARPNPQAMLVAPFLLVFCSLLFGLWVARRYPASKLIRLLGIACLAGGVVVAVYLLFAALFSDGDRFAHGADLVTLTALPTLAALLATYLLMKRQGLRAFLRAAAVSAFAFVAILFVSWNREASFADNLYNGWRPWSLDSPWSLVLAFAIIAFYLAINAAFLQPYLGDAARYFRNSPANVAVRREIRKQAVDTLDYLHNCGRYDRIVVVAHSLGCVVSYDMLRTYFSRVCNDLPPTTALGASFAEIDNAPWRQEAVPAPKADIVDSRDKARKTIAAIAAAGELDKPARERKYKSWLVTDFITLGNALTHAQFLMCVGGTADELDRDFKRRVREREFPTCPPIRLEKDGLLSFYNGKTKRREVHHGAAFGLTRWTNIYFPLSEIFWGDAIGGPVADIFGSHIVDVPVETSIGGGPDFFTHTAYWDVKREPDLRNAPHIVALRKAVDLADLGSANDLIA